MRQAYDYWQDQPDYYLRLGKRAFLRAHLSSLRIDKQGYLTIKFSLKEDFFKEVRKNQIFMFEITRLPSRFSSHLLLLALYLCKAAQEINPETSFGNKSLLCRLETEIGD